MQPIKPLTAEQRMLLLSAQKVAEETARRYIQPPRPYRLPRRHPSARMFGRVLFLMSVWLCGFVVGLVIGGLQ
jgi:hypothetical protein